MSELPVREMVLYKHGVGYFVRSGPVDGQEVSLTFQQDEINDVLKSLAIFDRAGGQVLGIHYQTPMDKTVRLASSSIRLSDLNSLRDLLRDLRGRQVTLTFETIPGSTETVMGRVIGVDQSDEQPRQPFGKPTQMARVTVSLVSILADDGQVRVFDFNMLRAVSIQDAQSERDLTYFLDTSMSEDQRRTIAIRLSGGLHQLVVSYVAPTPTWRVSYRIVAEADKGGETGKALLQGWGLFDNRLEEDLADVQVTLVAGQPISFIYDLYASLIPQRPIVQDETRVAPGPIEYAGALRHQTAEDIKALKGLEPRRRPGMYVGRAGTTDDDKEVYTAFRADGYLPSLDSTSMQPVAKTSESGEFFQYEVTTPVSVKRGESALVPIIGAEVSYQRELLYNGDKLPKHPVAALRFANTTGLTLERGPVTVVEDSDYKGEAVVPFTKDGNEVYLPYAVELGVHKSQSARSTEPKRLN